MRKSHLIAVMAALVVAPMALAHDPAGIPKNYCEPWTDWLVHDYGPPATGILLVLNEDGNLAGDCDGSGADLGDPGTPCAGFDDPADPLTFFVGLCDSDLNRPVADWDLHNEWALGGAWLLVDSGPGTPGGGGTLDCFGAEGHHTEFGSYAVDDVALGGGASFSIAADRLTSTPQNAACGDFETDESIDCIGSCTVPFGAGLDGTYIVIVQGTQGHVIESAGSGGPGLGLTMGPTMGSGGTMEFDGWGGAPHVSEAPGWSCAGPFDLGGEWEIQCSPILIVARAALTPAGCTSPFAVAGGTLVSFGTASVTVSCRNSFSASCSTSWVGAGACVVPPRLGLDSFPLHCRAQVLGSSIGGTLYASCGNLV